MSAHRPVSPPKLHAAVEAIAGIEALDASEPVAKKIRGLIPGGPVKDALSGTWLGHALHPLLTDTVIGTWTSALILDAIGGRGAEDAADKLIAVGLAAYGPTAITGASDWADTTVGDPHARRVGAVHAVTNGTAFTLMSASLRARRKGSRGRGKALAAAAGGMLAFGGHLGGHLSYVMGVGVDQTAFDPGPSEWTQALAAAELGEGDRTCVRVGETPVLLVRKAGRVLALHNRCMHRGGPLDEGDFGDGTVTCPWHGSVFRLEDGAVEQGPATAPQPAYETREVDGRIEIRLRA